MRTLAELASEFAADQESGLSHAQVADSRRRFGANTLTPLPQEPTWRKFLAKFDEPIIKILLAASLLKVIIDLFNASSEAGIIGLGAIVVVLVAGLAVASLRPWLPALLFAAALGLVGLSVGLGHPSYDGLAVMLAVMLATGVAFLAEYKSDREFEALNAVKDVALVKVTRDGEFHTIPISDVVVGDFVALEMGDEAPADGRLVRATEVAIDQSLMTGESEAVHKSTCPPDDAADGPEHPGCVYRGTQVVDGAGTLRVAAVGDETMLGQLARALSGSVHDDAASEDRVVRKLTIAKDLTPLQIKLKVLADLISAIGYIAALAIFAALVSKGLLDGTIHWPHSAAEFTAVVRKLLDCFVVMVIIIVVAVPEGLPMSVTISLALAMRKMTRSNSLVRQLVACETIGSATVICSDKTGTLTRNEMRVADVVFVRPAGPASEARRLFALNAAVNSTAELESKDGRVVSVGSSTEAALLHWLSDAGIDYHKLRRAYPVLYQVHFSSDRKRMTTVVRDGDSVVLLVKGAPDILLESSRLVLHPDGTARPWAEGERAAIEARLLEAGIQAMRSLGFAVAILPGDIPTDDESLHEFCDGLDERLAFVGIATIRDPLRPDVPAAIRECRDAGIEVKLITGDVATIATAIARDVGLLDRPDALVMTSAEFNSHSDAELKPLLPRLRVLARARPLDKFRIVGLLQEQGEVVAMTGDGTNDAPSLKKADVGLAMGIAGTEVAKEASKIVLLDDSFATIVRAVHWGRALYENIQRFVQFQLTINVSALVIAFLSPFLGFGEPPFTVLQFLWINIIMDTFAAIALCSEPPREGLMKHPPKKRDESLLTRAMIRTILTTAAFFVVVMLALLVAMKGPAESPGWLAGDGPRSTEFPLFTVRQATIFFTVFVLFQVWNLINCRSLSPSVSGFRKLGSNPTFLAIGSLILIGQFVIVTFGGAVFKVQPLTVQEWLVIAAATSSVVAYAEFMRRMARISDKTDQR